MKHSASVPLRHKGRTPQGISNKVLGVALAASLIPTLALSVALMLGAPTSPKVAMTLILIVVAAVAVFTVYEIRHLLRPVEMLTKFVDRFVSTGEIDDVPVGMDSALDGLVRNTRNAIVRLDLANRELAVVSKLDLLTGLPNRSFGSQRLEQDLARARRSGTPVTLVSVDLDDFKRLNDKYGIGVGDACLRYFADLAKTCIREGDWIARWGADEFLIMLWNANSANAENVISRIRFKLANSEEAQDAGINLTASFGYTISSHGERTSEVYAKAEGALSQAKRFGRNRAFGPSGVMHLS